MKFDIVIGNVVTIFNDKESYEDFIQTTYYIADSVELISPEEWVDIAIKYNYIKNYAENKYCKVYNRNYFTDQIKEMLESKEDVMNNSAKLLILISKQILVISEKLDDVIERLDSINTEIDTDAIADAITDNIDNEELAEKIIQSLDVDKLLL